MVGNITSTLAPPHRISADSDRTWEGYSEVVAQADERGVRERKRLDSLKPTNAYSTRELTRESEGNDGTLSGLAYGLDITAVGIHDVFRD